MENRNLKFIDLFSGIGGFRLGMEQAGHECVGYCEIDRFARQSYEAMYDTENEWTATDINKVTNEEWRSLNDKYGQINAICGGFPCQSFSLAGKREGFKNRTKGTLFFEIARAAEQIKPQYLFLENVKGLLNHEGGDTFRTILSTLNELGYDVEWCVLNSKDFGVAQHRERVFIIGHLRDRNTREVFREQGATKRTNSRIEYFFNARKNGQFSTKDVLQTNGVSKTLQTMQGGGREPKVAIKIAEKVKKGYSLAVPGDSINIAYPKSHHRRARVGRGFVHTLTTSCNYGILLDDLRIRKLMPIECWRLQGFPDSYYHKAEEVNSESQLYKQAGNAVTVPVINWIAERLAIESELEVEKVA